MSLIRYPEGQNLAEQGDLPGLLKGFLSNKSHYRAYEHLAELLQYCYRRLYTKDPLLLLLTIPIIIPLRHMNPILNTCCTILSFACLLSTVIAASISLALLAAIEKGDQLDASSRVDITVTYALLVGAIFLDVSSTAIFILPNLSFYHPCLAKPIQSSVVACYMKQWSRQIGQYNIINNAAMPRILHWFFHFDVEMKPITKDETSIEKFILDTLLGAGTRQEWSIASTRGQLALHNWMDNHKNEGHYSADHLKSLEETLKADFPTSVLILHIATDICYHYGGCTNSDHQAVKKHKQTSTQLSHYIMYLVFKCGVMLTTNSQVVQNRTRADINKFLLSHPPNVNDPRNKNDAHVMKLFEAIKEQQEGSMREIQIRHGESEDYSTVEIEKEEPTDIDDNAADEHMKKLKRSSQQTLTSPVLPRAVAEEDSIVEIENEEPTDIDGNAADEHMMKHKRSSQQNILSPVPPRAVAEEDSTVKIKNEEPTDIDDADVDEHMKKLKRSSQTLKSSVLARAVAVAEELIRIKNEAERWELIATVWAEMLYYTAPRCGGDFHYEHLSTGGEFVTHVLLLMYYLGPFLPPPQDA